MPKTRSQKIWIVLKVTLLYCSAVAAILLFAWGAWINWFVPKNALAFNDSVLIKAEIKDVREDVVTMTAEECDLDKANQAQLTNLTNTNILLVLSKVGKDSGEKKAEWEVLLQPHEVKTIRLPREKDGKITESLLVRKK